MGASTPYDWIYAPLKSRRGDYYQARIIEYTDAKGEAEDEERKYATLKFRGLPGDLAIQKNCLVRKFRRTAGKRRQNHLGEILQNQKPSDWKRDNTTGGVVTKEE